MQCGQSPIGLFNVLHRDSLGPTLIHTHGTTGFRAIDAYLYCFDIELIYECIRCAPGTTEHINFTLRGVFIIKWVKKAKCSAPMQTAATMTNVNKAHFVPEWPVKINKMSCFAFAVVYVLYFSRFKCNLINRYIFHLLIHRRERGPFYMQNREFVPALIHEPEFVPALIHDDDDVTIIAWKYKQQNNPFKLKSLRVINSIFVIRCMIYFCPHKSEEPRLTDSQFTGWFAITGQAGNAVERSMRRKHRISDVG